MGYSLHQPAPSPGRPPVDAPKRYGWRALPLWAARLRTAGPGAAAGTRAVGFVVAAFYLVWCLVSRALPGPWGAVVSPARRSSPPCARETAGLRVARASPPAPRTRPAPPGTATARRCLAGGCVCRTRGSSSLSGQRAAERPREGGIFRSVQSWCKGWGRGFALEGWRTLGRRALFLPSTGFGFWGGKRGSAETVGKRTESFVVRPGSGLCSVECGETCNGPGTPAPCHLVTSRLSRLLAPEVPGFVCSRECPGTVSSRCGAALPALGSVPRCSSLLAGRGRHLSQLRSPLAQGPPRRGLAPAALSSKIYEVPPGKGVVPEREGWEDLARDDPVLATQTRALPGPQVLDVRTTRGVLQSCLAGRGALGS